MRSRLDTFYTLLGIYIFCDIFMFVALSSLFKGKTRMLFRILYILTSIYIYYYGFYSLRDTMLYGSFFGGTEANFSLGLVITSLITKIVFTTLMLFQDFARILLGFGKFIIRVAKRQQKNPAQTFFPSRRKFLTMMATILTAIPFFTLLYSVTRGKYAYTINKVKLSFKDLPEAFEGFRIVQISDIHAGSLDNKSEVARGVKMINDQKPDAILFTGDLINSKINEIDPYIDIFKNLTATHGKYSCLGNHDYYGIPRKERYDDQPVYWNEFRQKHEAMGFQLLNNDSIAIKKSGASIRVLGVRNWGKERWFPKDGDLDLALSKTNSNDFCVLMSHDPTHWDEKILPHQRKIHLTLSGHTHGFQFGVNMPGFKWSPAQYRYSRWIGLYEEADQYLYVNRGFGFLAFPGRVGMWPEITVLELSKSV